MRSISWPSLLGVRQNKSSDFLSTVVFRLEWCTAELPGGEEGEEWKPREIEIMDREFPLKVLFNMSKLF